MGGGCGDPPHDLTYNRLWRCCCGQPHCALLAIPWQLPREPLRGA